MLLTSIAKCGGAWLACLGFVLVNGADRREHWPRRLRNVIINRMIPSPAAPPQAGAVRLPGGVVVRYWVYNAQSAGPSMVLVHGLAGSHHGFEALAAQLPGVQLIVPDVPATPAGLDSCRPRAATEPVCGGAYYAVATLPAGAFYGWPGGKLYGSAAPRALPAQACIAEPRADPSYLAGLTLARHASGRSALHNWGHNWPGW